MPRNKFQNFLSMEFIPNTSLTINLTIILTIIGHCFDFKIRTFSRE